LRDFTALSSRTFAHPANFLAAICVNLSVMSCLLGPHGHKVAVLQSCHPMMKFKILLP
jgi:hypothetical protein